MMILGIRDTFAVRVYDTHARLCLANKNLDHFLQCFAGLLDLNKEHPVDSLHELFFAARVFQLLSNRPDLEY